jgi:protein SCO1/2
VIVAGIGGAFILNQVAPPRNGETDFPVISQVSDFTLTNQLGQPVSREDLQGEIWIADLIFTRCAGPCPRLTETMSRIQRKLPADSPIRMISFTADPGHDAPEVLKQYGKKFGVDPQRWWFLTGEKETIYSLAQNDLKFTVTKNPQPTMPVGDQFLHSTRIVIVDRRGRVRGYFDGTDPKTPERVVNAVKSI